MKIKILILLTLSFFPLFRSGNVSAFMFWNQACSFSGTNSYAAFQHSASLDITGSFSVEAWLNPTNVTSPAFQILAEKRGGTLSNGYTVYLSNGQIAIRTNSSTRLVGNTVLPNNSWTHIACTYNTNNNIFSIYINGVADTSATVLNADPVSNNDSLRIGKGNINSPFEGYIDELRIWKKVLTPATISEVRRTSLGTSTGMYSQLSLSLTFQDNESSGTDFSLFDWSGNNNTGKGNNITAVDLSSRPSNTISPNEAVELDGVSDYLFGIDNADVSPVTGVTLEAWIYAHSTNGARTIIHKGTSGSGINYNLRLNAGILSATINGNTAFTSTVNIAANLWMHTAFTYNASDGKYVFYINGRKAKEGNITAGMITNGMDNLIIGSAGTAGTGFDGFIDEVRISNYVKTQLQINRFLYMSVDDANEPNTAAVNVVYNLDGYAYDNADNGPLLNFAANAKFSHNGGVEDQPVSPLNRADGINFSDGFNLRQSNKRIPETGTSGTILDSIYISLDTVISDINVFVAVNHNAEEEIELSLLAPNGEIVKIYDNQSLADKCDNIVSVFDDQADSTVASNGRYVSFAPRIKPKNSLNAMFAGNNSRGMWRLLVNDLSGAGIGRLCAWGVQFNGAALKIPGMAVRVFMEGFYRPVDSCVVDTITLHLRENFAPYNEVGINGETPDDNYVINSSFAGAVFGTSYYLQVEHRNSIETWSAHKLSFDFLTGGVEYNFTLSPDSAYGSNQIEVDTLPRYAMYGGDANQDDIVDVSDVTMVYNDASAFAGGYIVTDMTGDDFTDNQDLIITFNNSLAIVETIRP